LSTLTVPDVVKHGIIRSLFKNGQRDVLNNYRPITKSSQLCKLLEKPVKIQVTNFLKDHKFFFDHQYGFRENKNKKEFRERMSPP